MRAYQRMGFKVLGEPRRAVMRRGFGGKKGEEVKHMQTVMMLKKGSIFREWWYVLYSIHSYSPI